MKKNIRFIVLILLVALVATGLMAQSTATGRGRTKSYNVTIQANVKGAMVYIDNAMKGRAPITEKLSSGTYTIKVTANGYKDYVESVTISKVTTINAVLEPSTVKVEITANVKATLYLNKAYKGVTPLTLDLEPGRYSVELKAADYESLTESLNVSSKPSQSYNYKLIPATVPVTVTVNNAGGATITIDGKAIDSSSRGAMTVGRAQLLPGKYSVQMSATDFLSMSETVTVSSSSKGNNFSYYLTPAEATLKFNIPKELVNPNVKGAADEIKVYIDGVIQNAKGPVSDVKVKPGKHTVTIASGGLSVSESLDFKAASTVNFTLNMSLSVK